MATAVAASARRREESRGAHWRDDFAERRDEWRGHLIAERDPEGGLQHHFVPAEEVRQDDPLGRPMTTYRRLTEIVDRLTAEGLDADAVALIVSEALGEDLGGRGVLPPGTGAGFDVTSYATIPARGDGPG